MNFLDERNSNYLVGLLKINVSKKKWPTQFKFIFELQTIYLFEFWNYIIQKIFYNGQSNGS